MANTPAYMYLIRIHYAILSLNDLFLLLLEQELLKLNGLYVCIKNQLCWEGQ